VRLPISKIRSTVYYEPAAAGTTTTPPPPPADKKTAAETSEGSTAATQAGGVMPRFVIVNARTPTMSLQAAPAPPLKTVETFANPNGVDDFQNLQKRNRRRSWRNEKSVPWRGFRRGSWWRSKRRKKDPKLLSAEELENKSLRHRFHLYQYHIEKMERLLGTPMLSELLVDYV
jgi:hypothetical protein